MKCGGLVRVLCHSPSRRWWGLVVVALVLVAGCATPRRTTLGPTPGASDPGAPAWVGQPEGWAKLDAIDRWLAGDARRYAPYWQVQGELTLGEGRAEFARADLQNGGTKTNLWRFRVESARSGFERVLENGAVDELQEERAYRGLALLDHLEGVRLEPASSGTALSRASWRAKPPVESRLDNARGIYHRITIHHTADVPGVRFDGSLADSTGALRSIQHNHVDNRRYGDIGYHFLIDSAGRIFEGRDLSYQGAHAGGANNRGNIGICLLGNFEKTTPTSPALTALSQLLAELRGTWRIPVSAVVGHGELKSTLCPGKNLARWTSNYRRNGPRLSSLGASAEARPASYSVARKSTRRTRAATSGGRGGSGAVR
jgi:hypothetical protein